MEAISKKKFGRSLYNLDKRLSRDLYAHWQAASAQYEKALAEFLTKYSAKGPVFNNQGKMIGFYMGLEDKEMAHQLPEGFLVKSRAITETEEVFVVLLDTHYPSAKACFYDMKEVNGHKNKAPDFGLYVVEILDLVELTAIIMSEDGTPVAQPVIAEMGNDGRVYVSIPFGGETDVPEDHTAWLTPQFTPVSLKKFQNACQITG